MKKRGIVFFTICVVLVFLLYFLVKSNKKQNSDVSEIKNNFIINKIKYYSSANAISNTTNYQNPEWNLKVYQFTDIALYLNRCENVDLNNYITKICLDNFNLNSNNTKVYYLNPNNFGNSILDTNNIYCIEDVLEYNVINSSNIDNTQNYNIPIFFQDCSNPITIRIVTELSSNYQLPKEKTLRYNGSLINELGLNIKDLNNRISFTLKIDTKQGLLKNKRIDLEIPFENEGKSILDGDIEIDKKEEIKF